MRRLRHLEVVAWTLGCVLLGAYFGVRAWAQQASAEGVKAMEEVRAAQAAPSPSKSFDVPQPDTSLWSQQRLAAYRESMGRGEVPEAVLRIPGLKLTVPIYEGTSTLSLTRGAGHIEGTAPFGDSGNAGVAGHRDGFFRNLKDIRGGEILYIETADKTLAYKIVNTEIVDPEEIGVLADADTPTITLVTCYPFYYIGSAPKRFIVRAQRVSTPVNSRVATFQE